MRIKLTECWLLTKFIYILYSFYWSWILIAFPQFGGYLVPLGMSLVGITFLNLYAVGWKIESILYKPMIWWLLFCLVSGISSLWTADNTGEAISKLFVFVEIIAFMFCILAISKMEHSFGFCVNTFRMVCLVYAISIILIGSYREGRLTLYNSNGDAMICMCGIMLTLLVINEERRILTITRFCEIAYYLFCIIQTGSRKALICSVLFLLLWFFITGKEIVQNWSEIKQREKNFYILFLIISMIMIFAIVIPAITNSYAFNKILAGGDEVSDGYRILLYQDAWKVFLENPVFGVGYYQFIHHNNLGLYSHSTYFELLSCSGVVGTIIYFIPYFWIGKRLFLNCRYAYYLKDRKTAIIFAAYFVITLFLGIGMIHFYNEKFMIVYALMIESIYETMEREENVENAIFE